MNNFKEYLTEIFDSSVPYEITRHDNGVIKFIFRIEDIVYDGFIFIVDKDELISIDFEANGSFAESNLNKDQFKVYSTIYRIVKDLNISEKAKNYKISVSGFSKKQTNLYQKIFTYLTKRNVLYQKDGNYYIK